MKKIVMFMAAATTLAMASCSNDQELNINQGEAISFRTAFAMPTSRVAEATSIGNMTVTAMLGDEIYFQNVLFTKEGSTYTSARKYYWPGDGRELSFTAIPENQVDFIRTDYVPAATWDLHNDLLYSFGAKSAKNDAGVELKFYHVLSQVAIEAKNTNPAYEIKVVNAKIANVKKAGKFVQGANFNVSTWTAVSNLNSYTAKADYAAIDLKSDAAGFTSVMGDKGNAMVIPQQLTAWNKTEARTGAYLALKVSIKTKLDETTTGAHVYPTTEGYAWVAVPIATNWLPGKKYTYQLTFGAGAGISDPEGDDPKPVLDGEIKLNTVIEGWTDGTLESPKPAL